MPLTAKELFCLLFSALVHDYDHPGVNNNFLIQTNSPMALLYNDRSVLENHHVASALRLLLRPELNFLSGWAREEMAEVRSDIITLVLSTDLQVEHFSTLTHFKTLTSNPYWTEGCVEADPAGAMSHPSPPVMNKKDRVIVMKMLLKCADVANPSKRWPIYSEWFARYTEETFQQGDEERRLGLPISPLCDRSDVQLPKSQLGFIEFITLPLYEALHQAVAIPALLDNLSSNHSYWQRVRDKVLAPPAASTSPPGPAASATIIVE
ncbi:hypothetical protein CXG81DRAFT_8704 [Caulochytrium protostelioides]|uniref:PDEase domain-containing protein n=1 Tax=Caulochytrium protostelioides TaxID=1555241 RepID=A0A4P9XFY4_9FUNG|nr:hypothetical protein CXG81DRAFT_8704 [Caulochytrium protostelioides]|eukprot:RKP04080.1 hypothetical protein CXG81DRAFT_8704 [Caulochytrium protostelioides]